MMRQRAKFILCLSTSVSISCLAMIDDAQAQVAPNGPTPTTQTSEPVEDSPPQDIIVTGTRATGLRAADSPAPVQILGEAALEHVGQPNLTAALTQIVPSFTAQSFGGDAANLTLSASLRGLNPNQTLVLVNGKRRHSTANIQVQPSPFQGAAAPDLDLIPPGSIERVEVLQDGAAAQYGSDAIAGVINVILKTDRQGGSASLTGGALYQGGGKQTAQAAQFGLPLGQAGYFDISLLHRFQDYSVRNGGDNRVSAPDGALLTGVPVQWATLPGFPNRLNRKGQPRGFLTTVVANAGYDFGPVEAYSFGSYSRRTAASRATYRLPTRVARTVSGVTTVFAPNGFLPEIAFKEEDYSITGGLRGQTSGIDLDASVTLGRDHLDLKTINSANASLFVDTGTTPSTFYDGSLTAQQLTINLDAKRDLNVGATGSLVLAAGGEYRRDTYAITQGDEGSIYKEGGQGYPGFRPSDAGQNRRHAWSGYIDLLFKPVESVTIDLAGRYEDYSDFGSKVIGKLTGRYDVSSQLAVRGTISTGFRAPTLAESFYSSTTVSPTTATVFLPANSPEARLVGFGPLKPETSTNLSAGLVLRPVERLTVTLDAYQISIDDRIAATGTLLGQSGSTVVNAAVLEAIRSRGNVIDPTVTFAGITLFTNGIDTRSRGIDAAVSYSSRPDWGRIDWSLTGNLNKTRILKNNLGEALFNRVAQSYVETASPRYKVGVGALLTTQRFELNIRETLYGKSSAFASPSGVAPFYQQKIGGAFLTDIEVTTKLDRGIRLALGANNLFNKKPATVSIIPGSATTPTRGPALENGNVIYGLPLPFSPYGAFGGYYYARMGISF